MGKSCGIWLHKTELCFWNFPSFYTSGPELIDHLEQAQASQESSSPTLRPQPCMPSPFRWPQTWVPVLKRPQGSDLCQDNEGVLVGRGLPVCVWGHMRACRYHTGWQGSGVGVGRECLFVLWHTHNHFQFMASESNMRSQEMRTPESKASAPATERVQEGWRRPWSPVWNQIGRCQLGKLRGHLMAVE